MTRLYQVRHHQAIWETASFEVEADDDPAKAREWIEINLDRLMSEAGDRDGLDIASGDTVEGVDSDLEVTPSSPATPTIALHVVTTRGVLNAMESQRHTYTIGELRESMTRLEAQPDPGATELAQLNAMRSELADRTRAERRAHRRAKGAKPSANPRRRVRREP